MSAAASKTPSFSGGRVIGERSRVNKKSIVLSDVPLTAGETRGQNTAILLWRHPYTRILFVALVLRAVWALLIPVVPVSDSNAYDVFARNLANGFGFGWGPGNLTAYWPVGTSFAYSILYRIFGHIYAPIVVFHLVLGLIAILFSMLLAERWFNRHVAILTGVLLSLWPSQIEFTTVLASELIFVTLLVLSLWVWSSQRIHSLVRALLLGVLLAAATYVRPMALLLPVVLASLTIAKERQWLPAVGALVLELVVIAALILPWSIRNTRVFGSFALTTTNGGVNLWMGNNPQTVGGYMEYPGDFGPMNEVQVDKYLGATATSYIRHHPVQFVGRTLLKLVKLHDRETIGVVWNEKGLAQRFGTRILLPLKIISTGFWLLALGFALFGIILLLLGRSLLSTITNPAVLIWLYFALLHAVIVVQDRYHFASIPMIAMLAAFGIASSIQYVQRRSNAPAFAAHPGGGQFP